MRIGDLAAATSTSARSLRYYEEQGLLASERSPGGQRGYPAGAIERVGLIRSLLAAGLTSATIRDVLPCVADETIRTPWLAARLGDELTRVERQIEDLHRTRDILAGLVEDYRVNGTAKDYLVNGTAETVRPATTG
jgi:DNA-binding transcriptional MerR regulator